MTIFEATQMSTLLGNTAVSVLVDDRIYPLVLPSNPTLPAVTYQLISSPRIQTQTGPSSARPRYRWNCWAKTYDQAVEVAVAIARALGPSRWVEDEDDQNEPLTGLFRRRVETMGWIDAPEAI